MTAAQRIPTSQSAQPQSSPDRWIDLASAATRSGRSEDAIRKLIERNGWLAKGYARKDGHRWQIRESIIHTLSPKPGEPEDGHLTDAQRTELYRSHGILMGWLRERAATNGKLAEADRRYAARVGVSIKTLYRWRDAWHRDGWKGLEDSRWVPARRDETNTYAEFLDELKRLWLDQRQRSVKLCYDIAYHAAQEKGWPIPSLYVARRFLRNIPRKTVEFHRLGRDKYESEHGPFIERDYTKIVCPLTGEVRPFRSNDIWCFDHHQFDVWVLPPGGGKPVRPWACALEDLRSRKFIAVKIAPNAPDSGTIIAALRDALRDCGTPLIAYTDNGKDFDCAALQGITKRQRQRGSKIEDGGSNGGILGMLGIKVQHARPFNAKAKPIERTFGTLCSRFSKLWDTYCGSDPQHRPDDLNLAKAPEFQAFCGSFADWLDSDYHRATHSGHGMDGLSPAVIYQRDLVEKRPVDQRLLDNLTLRRTPPLKVGRNGVTWGGISYGRAKLSDRKGQMVQLAIDDRDLSQVQVFDASGRFICLAACNERIPHNTSREQLKAAMSDLRADRKARAEHIERRPRLADSLPDRLYRRAAALRAQQPGGDETDVKIKPVRTPLDSQLPAIQRAVEARPLKLAAGAESSMRFAYDADFASGEEDQQTESRFTYHASLSEDQP